MQSENHMHVGRGEKFAATCLKPACAGARLTLRAMAVSATVIGDGGAMSTAGALIDMTAECGGAATGNGQQDLDMGPADPLAVALEESLFLQCGPGRPPPEAAGSSIPPAGTCLSALANPEDWPWPGGDVAKDEGRSRSLLDRDVPGAAEWCAGQRHSQASASRNSVSGCGDGSDSADRRAGRPSGRHTTRSLE